MAQNQEYERCHAKMSKAENNNNAVLHIEHLDSMAGENKA
jgi:hypothetical protein